MALAPHNQLRELLGLEDIVGGTLLSSVAKVGGFFKFSHLLLSKAYSSGDLGVFEAAARCVAAEVPPDSTATPSDSKVRCGPCFM